MARLRYNGLQSTLAAALPAVTALANVKCASTGNIVMAGSAPNVVDGFTLTTSDRVLVKDATTQANNGVWTVTTLGTGANGTWTRATDMDVWTEVPGAYVNVLNGTANRGTGWMCTSAAGGTINVTAITWAQVTITFSSLLQHGGGISVPSISAATTDYLPLTLINPANGLVSEIVWLVAYTVGGTTGTILRAPIQEQTMIAGAHNIGDPVTHDATAYDLNDGTVPIGAMMMWPTATAPTGWLLMNGQSLALYPALSAVLGGIANLPDVRDKFIQIAGTVNALGGIGGQANMPTHFHTTPAHQHAYDVSSTAGTSNATLMRGTATVAATIAGAWNPANSGGANSGNAGTGGSADENRPPFYTFNLIIKY